ncbi:hypothetical protein L0B70_12425 [Kaistella sp. 97-N-M2]|uniref:hypothetical protein n=1 Tax=Kaistella sp. 97-N-M2 TaxID=2908645 RepID=UPI001F421929|nr:hypothetical protein [Kaistella sp. 97-N-M2]UJF29627.1 hypothetical protein L0B70_12425 [Kaistella sp. 97-N-M2]
MDQKIPKQEEGGFSDNVSEVKFETVAKAALHFETVKQRFLDINSWEIFAGEEKAEFMLCDEKDDQIRTEPQVGNYIKIKVPGLHNETGDSFDWVRIEHFEKEKSADGEIVYIRVRPCENPHRRDGKIAHFFKDKATSNFLVRWEDKSVFAEVHGRNEKPNTEDLNILEKARNSIVAIGGIIGGSKFQWKSLTDGLVKKDEK